MVPKKKPRRKQGKPLRPIPSIPQPLRSSGFFTVLPRPALLCHTLPHPATPTPPHHASLSIKTCTFWLDPAATDTSLDPCSTETAGFAQIPIPSPSCFPLHHPAPPSILLCPFYSYTNPSSTPSLHPFLSSCFCYFTTSSACPFGISPSLPSHTQTTGSFMHRYPSTTRSSTLLYSSTTNQHQFLPLSST